MELWIRTQDKSRLIKVNSLQYEELRKTYYISGYCFNEVDSCVLGTYTTEKRALEVLDEIQNILKPKMFLKSNGGAFVSNDNDLHIINPTYEKIEPLGTYVYEMPEE